jgi:hypothetical protein
MPLLLLLFVILLCYRLWDLQAQSCVAVFGDHMSVARGIAFMYDGCTLVTGGRDQVRTTNSNFTTTCFTIKCKACTCLCTRCAVHVLSLTQEFS